MRQTINDRELRFFLDNGYLILRGVLCKEELRRLQAAAAAVRDEQAVRAQDAADFLYKEDPEMGARILWRVDYILDKHPEFRTLLGHPFILRTVERLVGRDLIPTRDSLVVHCEGRTLASPWHRDVWTECVGDHPVFNVGFYLDEAGPSNCLWVMPGSHTWSDDKVEEVMRSASFDARWATPIHARPGDVTLHNINLVHGSPGNPSGAARCTVYYEFRTARVEAAVGPHVPAFIPLKQRVLLTCIEHRAANGHASPREVPYVYRPPSPYNTACPPPDGRSETFRHFHADYLRVKPQDGVY